jgi:hypothetical protein
MMDFAACLDRVDWPGCAEQLDQHGYALTGTVLRAGECRDLISMFDDGWRYRSVIDMRRHRFGSGMYKYFAAPLPDTVETMRRTLYPPLARIANEWAARLRLSEQYPPTLGDFLERCHSAGQRKPTPLIFRYEQNDFNALHQDIYGDVRFPFQVLTVLSRANADFEGGEFLLVTQIPRAQSVGEAVSPARGQLLIFPNARRPMRGSRGWYAANVRHGVSPVRRGIRHTLGVIFHDAR